MTGICRHCELKPVSRPRGLCWRCFYWHGVKEMYPATGPEGYRGVGHEGRQLPTPTIHRPGTPEKIATLGYRAAREQQLFSPDDAKQ